MVCGWFGKREEFGPELRMSRKPDELGIVWKGAVVEGRMNVAQGLSRDFREMLAREREVEYAGGGRWAPLREHPMPLPGGAPPRKG